MTSLLILVRLSDYWHVFLPTDVKDLISMLADDQGDCAISCSYKLDTSDSICPPRVRAMLASRACRSSIMIGDSLGRNEMQKVIKCIHVIITSASSHTFEQKTRL